MGTQNQPGGISPVFLTPFLQQEQCAGPEVPTSCAGPPGPKENHAPSNYPQSQPSSNPILAPPGAGTCPWLRDSSGAHGSALHGPYLPSVNEASKSRPQTPPQEVLQHRGHIRTPAQRLGPSPSPRSAAASLITHRNGRRRPKASSPHTSARRFTAALSHAPASHPLPALQVHVCFPPQT